MRAALLSVAALAICASPATAQIRFEDVTETHLPQSPAWNSMDVEVADLNGDGLLDLVAPQEWLVNAVYFGEPGGRFRLGEGALEVLAEDELALGPPQLNQPGMGHDSEDVSISDFDGDGVLDLIIVTEDDVRFGRTGVHEYYRGAGDGRFTRVRGVLPDTEANAVAHADLNGDGAPDLLIVGAGQDRLLINDGRGGFRDETSARLPREAATGQDGEFADLDGDGDLDIVLGMEGGHALWLNDGQGRFTDASRERLPAPGFVEARKVAPVDVDGDGDLDVVRADRPFITVWLNDGSGRFADVTAQVLAGDVGAHVLAVELADFDGDGLIDIYLGQLRTSQGSPDTRDRLLLQRRQ